MHTRNSIKTTVTKDINGILIPDGTETILKSGSDIFIIQVLGGMFSVQTEEGYLVRIDGKDALYIGQSIPKESLPVTKEDIDKNGINFCVNEQLKNCYDPEIPVNIVDLGLVYEQEIKLSPSNEYWIRIEMTLTAPGCGMGEIIKSDIEKRLKNIPSVSVVVVDLVFDPPWDSNNMSEAAKLKLGFL